MSALDNLLLGWALVTGLVAVVGGFVAMVSPNWRDRRDGARIMFLAPVWPLLLVGVIVKFVSLLWREADWRSEFREGKR